MPIIQCNMGDHTSTESASGWIAIPAEYRETMRWARRRAILVADNHPPANTYFRSLKHGRSLKAILADSSIWINYLVDGVNYGFCEMNARKEIAMCTRAFREGRWQLLGTLIHELAHSNGADEDNPNGNQAETALVHCGLGYRSEQASGVDDPRTPYSPTISG